MMSARACVVLALVYMPDCLLWSLIAWEHMQTADERVSIACERERKIILTTNAPALFMKMVNQIEPLQPLKIFHSRIKFASLPFAFIFVCVCDVT